MRPYCHLLFFHSEMNTGIQRDTATCLRSHSKKGADTGLQIKCSFHHSSTSPGGSEHKHHRGPCWWRQEEESTFPSCQLTFHCLEMQGFLPSKSPRPRSRAVFISDRVSVMLWPHVSPSLPMHPPPPLHHSTGNLISGCLVPRHTPGRGLVG